MEKGVIYTWLGGWSSNLGYYRDGSSYAASGAIPVRPTDRLAAELAAGHQGGATGGAVVAAG